MTKAQLATTCTPENGTSIEQYINSGTGGGVVISDDIFKYISCKSGYPHSGCPGESSCSRRSPFSLLTYSRPPGIINDHTYSKVADKGCPDAVKKRTTPDARLANMANIILPRAVDSVECSATETCLTVQSTPFY
jgi:hypothetical protein